MNPGDTYRHKRLLITGSTGYIATRLIQALRDVDCHITRLSRPGTTFSPMPGRAQIREVTAELNEPETWERLLKGVDYLFHFAAQTSFYVSQAEPLLDWQVNFLPLWHILESCRKNGWSPVILLAGTVTQAGMPLYRPADEKHPNRPTTFYDLHKLTAETHLSYYARQGIVRGVTLRLANVYGPGPRSSSADRGMLNGMIRRALQGETLTIYGDGRFVRDFIYIDDLVRAFLVAGAAVEKTNANYYIIGSGQGWTIAEAIQLAARQVERKTGRPVLVTHVTPPAELLPIESRDFVADTTRFTQDSGWKAMIFLEEGVNRTIDHYLQGAAN